MKLKAKLTTGNLMDWEDVFFVDTDADDNVEDDKKGTFNSSFRAVKAAIVGGWFSDIEPDADPMTIVRAVDSDEFLERASDIIEIYQEKKLRETEQDPNS